MKKAYILPTISLTLCLITAAKTSLSSSTAVNPALIRPILIMAGGAPSATVEESEPEGAGMPPVQTGMDSKSLARGEVPQPVFERTAAVVPAEELKISNLAKADISVPELLSLPDEQRGGTVLILHTHGCESYTPTKQYNYKPSKDFRTTDKDFNVVRIGDEIEKALTERGIKTIHDTTLCDEPSFNDSYNVSLAVAKRYLKENPDIKVILDVHRDSIEGEDGKPVKTLGAKDTSQLMFVIGTDSSGLDHPLWRQNLAFALRLQQRIQSKYPDIMRPVNLRKNRFNQQVSPGSIIIEVGTDANTLEEALNAARIFGEELGEYLS